MIAEKLESKERVQRNEIRAGIFTNFVEIKTKHRSVMTQEGCGLTSFVLLIGLATRQTILNSP